MQGNIKMDNINMASEIQIKNEDSTDEDITRPQSFEEENYCSADTSSDMVSFAEPWDGYSKRERGVNFTQRETLRFRALIEKHKDVMFSKKTDAVTNSKKNKAWAAIHAEFNAGSDQPRTVRQLKAKLDNIKKSIRKDQRRSKIKTEGGHPAPSAVTKEAEWVRTVMPKSLDGMPSVVDDDYVEVENTPMATDQILNDSQIVINLSEIKARDVQAQENTKQSENSMNTDSVVVNKVDSKARHNVRYRKRLHPSRSNGCHDLKSEALIKIKEYEENIYLLRIKHMEEKRKEEKAIFDLKKRKLLLEIMLLENKLI